MSFGKRLRKLRENSGMTLKELSDVFDLKPSTIAHYERGTRHPDHEIIVKIAAYFNVSTDYLLGHDIETQSPKDDIEPTPQEIEDVLNNQVMYQGIPLTEDEKESVREFIRLAFKTIRSQKKDGDNAKKNKK